jgi:hypothetical protein
LQHICSALVIMFSCTSLMFSLFGCMRHHGVRPPLQPSSQLHDDGKTSAFLILPTVVQLPFFERLRDLRYRLLAQTLGHSITEFATFGFFTLLLYKMHTKECIVREVFYISNSMKVICTSHEWGGGMQSMEWWRERAQKPRTLRPPSGIPKRCI